MYQIEHGVKDREKAMASHPVLSELEADREALRDDFALNYLARKQFRVRFLNNILCPTVKAVTKPFFIHLGS